MASVALNVRPLDGTHYRVSGGQSPHLVDMMASTCDCKDFEIRGVYRTPPSCKHLRAVTHFRAADPQGPMLDALTDKQTLDVVDPSHGEGYEPYVVIPIDPEDKAVA